MKDDVLDDFLDKKMFWIHVTNCFYMNYFCLIVFSFSYIRQLVISFSAEFVPPPG